MRDEGLVEPNFLELAEERAVQQEELAPSDQVKVLMICREVSFQMSNVRRLETCKAAEQAEDSKKVCGSNCFVQRAQAARPNWTNSWLLLYVLHERRIKQ
jgi:hypothetical protein